MNKGMLHCIVLAAQAESIERRNFRIVKRSRTSDRSRHPAVFCVSEAFASLCSAESPCHFVTSPFRQGSQMLLRNPCTCEAHAPAKPMHLRSPCSCEAHAPAKPMLLRSIRQPESCDNTTKIQRSQPSPSPPLPKGKIPPRCGGNVNATH